MFFLFSVKATLLCVNIWILSTSLVNDLRPTHDAGPYKYAYCIDLLESHAADVPRARDLSTLGI